MLGLSSAKGDVDHLSGGMLCKIAFFCGYCGCLSLTARRGYEHMGRLMMLGVTVLTDGHQQVVRTCFEICGED